MVSSFNSRIYMTLAPISEAAQRNNATGAAYEEQNLYEGWRGPLQEAR
jgi:hypothetical protein